MAWTLSAFTVLVFASGLVALVVSLAAFRERPDPMAWPLAVLMIAVAAWAIPHAISFGYTAPGRVAFWHRVQYPGIVLAPVAYLVVALRYAGYERRLTRRWYTFLAVIPVLTLVVVWTNPYHGLFWHSYSVARVDGASVLVPEYGPWYWLNLGYLYVVTAVALLSFASVVVNRGPVYRKQAIVMFVGGLVPLLVNGAANFGAGSEPTIDFTTTALAVTGLTFALALFRLDLLDIRPVARDRMLNKLDDGVVVVGPEGRIRDYNPTAERILGNIAVNQSAEAVLPSDIVPDGGELVVETDEGERIYRTRSSPLTDGGGREIGRIVYLNDLTELVEREQRISVLNRVLRHNVRNELTVTSGHLEILERRVPADTREHVRAAMESTERLIEFSEKARHVERTLQESGRTRVCPVTTFVEQVVTDTRATFPDAVIEFEPPDRSEGGVSVSVVDEELFEMAIAELVENAVVHSDHSPRVTVTVRTGAEAVHVRVADNGPGIPTQETEILTASTETNLEHSSGLGLWLVEWTASLSGGELSFAESDSGGTVATVTLPTPDD